MDFAELVSARLEELGENVNSFEARMGWKQGFLRAFVREDSKRSEPTLSKADLILTALGKELYFGDKRDAGPVAELDIDDTLYAHIPLHDAELAAGDGVSNSGDAVVEALAFRRDWLRRVGVAASAARLVRVTGDSMEPTLRSGDMVMVDTARRDIPVRRRSEKDMRPAPIYALLDQGDARVKRVERPTKEHYLLVSDNRAAELRPAADIELLGRVVWWGHTVREL